jgi:hypothetical protein
LTHGRGDLVRRVCNALETADLTLDVLGEEGYSDPDAPGESVSPDKVLAETALLLIATQDAAGQERPIGERLDQLTRRLAPLARSERMAAGLCLDPGNARLYAFPHACLVRLGNPDPAFDRLVRESLVSQAAQTHERAPHRVLEQEWLRRVWDPPPGTPAPRAGTATRSILGTGLDVLSATQDDIYSLTHALLYLTDLGGRRVRLPRPARIVVAEAEAALAHTLDDQDYDPAAEVLLTWPLLRRRWSAAATFGFRVLMRVEDEAGFLPAPTVKLDRYWELSGEARTRYTLAMAYHTVYVMGLLCGAALRPGCAPPAELPRTGISRGSAELVLEAGVDRDAARHWSDQLAEASPRDRDSLAPLLLTIELRRAVAGRDLTAVRRLLEVAAGRAELASTLAAQQAVELLRRARALEAVIARVTEARVSGAREPMGPRVRVARSQHHAPGPARDSDLPPPDTGGDDPER